jgi:predicted permease
LIPFLSLALVLLASALLLRRWAPPALAIALNWWVINIALPALILAVLPTLELGFDLWLLVIPHWLLFAAGFFLFRFVGMRRGWSRDRIAALTLVGGLGNTAFVGLPLLEAFRGKEALAYGAVADQLGCFIALAIGGALTIAIYTGTPAHPLRVARQTLRFPPFLALLAGLIVGQLGGWPEPVDTFLQRIGATLTPIALFAIGLRLEPRLHAGQIAPASLALGWKLLAMPALTLALALLVGAGGLTMTVSVLQTAMPPMFSATILADQYDFDPPLAYATTGAGLLLGFASVTAWNALL